MIDKNDIKNIYESQFFKYKNKLLDENDSQLNYILEYIPKNKNICILDAGCGDARYSDFLINKGYKNIFAFDLFKEIPDKKIKYTKADISLNLPYSDKQFDFIFCNSTIYYSDNIFFTLKEFKRIIKEGGILIFTAHTKYSIFTLCRVFKRDFLKMKAMKHLHGVNFYSANFYKKILQELNFKIVLQDGYETSFMFNSLYQKIHKLIYKIFKIKLVYKKPYINNGIIGKIKSEISYHSVFVVLK